MKFEHRSDNTNEVIVNQPKFNKLSTETLYLEYFNDFLTIGAFANYNGFTESVANRVINIGRKINHRKG